MAEMEALNAENKAELMSDEDSEEAALEEEEIEKQQQQKKQQKGKKGKKGKQQQQISADMMLSDDDDDAQEPAPKPANKKQNDGKKKKKGKQQISADLMLSDDDDANQAEAKKKTKKQQQQQQQQQKQNDNKKKGKKGKKQTVPSELLLLSDDDDDSSKQQGAKGKGKGKGKGKDKAGEAQQQQQQQQQEGDQAKGGPKKKKLSKLAQALKAEREAFAAKEQQRKQEEEERKRREEEERLQREEEERKEAERREKKRERERARKQRKKEEEKKKELERTEEEKAELARQKLAQMFGGDIDIAAAQQAKQQQQQQQQQHQQQRKQKKKKKQEEEAARQAELERQRLEEEERKKKEAEEEEEEPDNWEDLLDDSDLEGDDGGAAGENSNGNGGDDDGDDNDNDNDDDDDDDDDDGNDAGGDSNKYGYSDDEEGDEAAVDVYKARAPVEEKEHKTQDELHEERIEQARMEIQRRREEHERNRTTDVLRSPVCAVLGHVDTGKTKLLDKIRRSNVQDGEAGGITQQIGATYIPKDEIERQTTKVKKGGGFEVRVPGLLVIDTPGHESFSNLRTRGSSLCNMAVLVVDIMHGIEPQTAESIELLRKRRAPFIIALNKVDRLNGWIRSANTPIQNSLKKQKAPAMQDFETRLDLVKLQFAEKGINTELYWKNKNIREYVNIVPTSAHTGEGIPDLLFLLVSLTQKMLAKALAFSEELECTVLEVKEVQGHGTTIDVILTQGVLREGDTIVLGGLEGPIVTTARSLLMPAPLKELRVKNAYVLHKEVRAAHGVKIAAKGLEKAVAGLPLFVAHTPEEVEVYREEAARLLKDMLNSIKTVERGVCVQASTLGSLEALLEFLRAEKIPVSAVNIGPVHKRDVTRCSIQLQRDPKYACILAFDVAVDPDAKRFAAREGIRIFEAEIIYHLEESFRKHMEEVKQRLRDQYRNIAVFPCRLTILPDCVFNARDPIVVGVRIEEGLLRPGTPLAVPAKGKLDIGVVSSLQFEHKEIELAKKGQEVSIKIEPAGGEKKMVGRHFEVTDDLVSRVSRESIDAVKNYFRDDLTKDDWRLMAKLKGVFGVI